MGKNSTPPIPTATGKLPKPKNQTILQSKHRMGKIQRYPSPQREQNKNRKKFRWGAIVF
jgi:hypothetical protein